MKTLVESLFDKDLAEKNLPVFGDMYVVDRIESHSKTVPGVGPKGVPAAVSANFNLSKLKRDVKPMDLSKVEYIHYSPKDIPEEIQCVLALIADITILPSDKDKWKSFSEILKYEIKEVLDKYKNMSKWVDNRAFVTMFIGRDGIPYLRIGNSSPFAYLEIYYKEK